MKAAPIFQTCSLFFIACLAMTNLALGQQATTRAVVFGVSEYEDNSFSVDQEVRKDGELYAAFLRSRSGGLLPAHHIQLNTGKSATVAQFTAALNWLEEESLPNDQVVVYLSGYVKLLEGESDMKPYFYFSDSPSVPAAAGALSLSSICFTIQELCNKKSLRYNLYLQLNILPEEDAENELWQDWMQAFEESFSMAWAGKAKGKAVSNNSFTRVLLDGLMGGADRNGDESVIPKEAFHYLKSNRKEIKKGQAMLVACSKSETHLSVVQSSNQFSEDTEYRDNLFPTLVDIELTNKENAHLSKESDKIQGWYNDFIISMKLGKLLEPKGQCAADLYDSLLQVESLAPLHSHWRRKLGAALLDETQQALNAYLKTDTKELFRRWRHAEHYEVYPLYMAKAVELMGSRSFMMPILQTKLHYFEGLKARLDGVKYGEESNYFQVAKLEQQIALTYEPEAAFVWNELGVVYAMLGHDSSKVCFHQAIALSPTWGIPYSNLSLYYQQKGDWDQALEYADASVELNPWNVIALNSFGSALMYFGNYQKADEQFRQAIAVDINYEGSYYNLSCLQSLRGEVVSSAHWLDQALAKGYDNWDHILTDPDLINLRKTLQFSEIKGKYKVE